MTDLDSGADLHALMDRALSDLATPVERLREGAVRRGRPQRRRRRAGAALGGIALAVAAVAITLPAMTGGGSAPSDVASDPEPPPSASADRPAGWWDMPGRVMERRLDTLLPAGLTITDANLGNEELAPGEKPHGGFVQIDVADIEDGPAGGLNVMLYAPQPEDDAAFVQEQITCPGNLDRSASCTEMLNDTGGPIGRTSRWRAGGVDVIEVTQLMPDGGIVYAAASNSSDDKWGEGSSVDATAPPVTLGRLKAIALDPTWESWTPQR
jgi:hypothetical protein